MFSITKCNLGSLVSELQRLDSGAKIVSVSRVGKSGWMARILLNGDFAYVS